MSKTSVFSKTAKGIMELRERKLGLPRQAYHLLSIVDGRSTQSELVEKYGLGEESTEQVFSYLLSKKLVNPIFTTSELDVVEAFDEAGISVAELDPEEGARLWAEAQRGAKILHEQGFFSPKIHPLQAERGRPSILYVEDDPLLAHFLTVLLTHEGFDVRHAVDGKAMFSAMKEAVPDLVLLDVMLPDTSGFQLLEWIRKQPQLVNLPAIMLTSQVSNEDVMRGMRAGADGYIFKSSKIDPLLQCIRSVLGL